MMSWKAEKMIGRHPHVFGDANYESEEVLSNGKRGRRGRQKQSLFLRNTERNAFALSAHRIQARAAGWI